MVRHADTEMTGHEAEKFMQFLRNQEPGVPLQGPLEKHWGGTGGRGSRWRV